MIVNLSPTPECYYQTLCSLRFAEKAKGCDFGKVSKHVVRLMTPKKKRPYTPIKYLKRKQYKK
jgi:hypothetical protein